MQHTSRTIERLHIDLGIRSIIADIQDENLILNLTWIESSTIANSKNAAHHYQGRAFPKHSTDNFLWKGPAVNSLAWLLQLDICLPLTDAGESVLDIPFKLLETNTIHASQSSDLVFRPSYYAHSKSSFL